MARQELSDAEREDLEKTQKKTAKEVPAKIFVHPIDLFDFWE